MMFRLELLVSFVQLIQTVLFRVSAVLLPGRANGIRLGDALFQYLYLITKLRY